MKRLRLLLLLVLAALILCGSAGAEKKTKKIQPYAVLNHAFTVLEKGNPFTERYNRIAGQKVKARMAQGAPYFWGAQEDHLFAKEPDYVVVPAWSDSPS